MNAATAIIAGVFVVLVLAVVVFGLARAARVGDEIAAAAHERPAGGPDPREEVTDDAA